MRAAPQLRGQHAAPHAHTRRSGGCTPPAARTALAPGRRRCASGRAARTAPPRPRPPHAAGAPQRRGPAPRRVRDSKGRCRARRARGGGSARGRCASTAARGPSRPPPAAPGTPCTRLQRRTQPRPRHRHRHCRRGRGLCRLAQWGGRSEGRSLRGPPSLREASHRRHREPPGGPQRASASEPAWPPCWGKMRARPSGAALPPRRAEHRRPPWSCAKASTGFHRCRFEAPNGKN
eukprot:COSAG01_NODE_64_length_29509_cov_1035.985209_3_plen_234_part_00